MRVDLQTQSQIKIASAMRGFMARKHYKEEAMRIEEEKKKEATRKRRREQ